MAILRSNFCRHAAVCLVGDLFCCPNDANRALERIKLISGTSVGHLLPNDLLSKRGTGSSTGDILCCKQYCERFLWPVGCRCFQDHRHSSVSVALSIPHRRLTYVPFCHLCILLSTKERGLCSVLKRVREKTGLPQDPSRFLLCRRRKIQPRGFSKDTSTALNFCIPGY